MKKLLTILFTLFSFVSFSQTLVTQPLTRNNTADTYPTNYDSLGRGGWVTAQTITIRNAIPALMRREGMIVHVINDSTYQLIGGIANVNWKSFSGGGRRDSTWAVGNVQYNRRSTTGIVDTTIVVVDSSIGGGGGGGGITALTNDVSATGTGSVAATVTGIKNNAIPVLSTGNLKWNGAAWVFDNTTSSNIVITWGVLDSLSTPPAVPVTGNKYLVGTSPTGVFVSHANQIATYGVSSYTFQTATVGDLLLNSATGIVSNWSGTTWMRVGKLTIHSGGDSYTTILPIGTSDSNSVYIVTNGVPKLSIAPDGTTNLSKNGNGSVSIDATFPVYPTLYFGGTGSPDNIGFDGVGYFFLNDYNGQWKFHNVHFNQDEAIISLYGNRFRKELSIGSVIPLNSATLDLQSTKRGFLPPRVTTAQMNFINSGVATGTITTGGSGYTNGAYGFILLQGGSFATDEYTNGTGTVSGGIVTGVVIGGTYGQAHVGDVLTSSSFSGGTGFTYTVNTVLPPTAGLVVYNTDSAALCVYNGTAWRKLIPSSANYGSSVASASAITPTGNMFHVTGTTTITSITSTTFRTGDELTIIFDGILTFTDGSNLKLNGNFVTTADDVIKLAFDGVNFFEISRSVN